MAVIKTMRLVIYEKTKKQGAKRQTYNVRAFGKLISPGNAGHRGLRID